MKLKMASIYLFVFVYGTIMLKPAMPYLKNFAAHILFYKDHILTVHSHNGKFHVHADIALAEKNDQQRKGTSNNNFKKDNFCNERVLNTGIVLRRS